MAYKKAVIICCPDDAQEFLKSSPDIFTSSVVVTIKMRRGYAAIVTEDDFEKFIKEQCKVVMKSDIDEALSEVKNG